MVTAQRELRHNLDSTMLEAANRGKVACIRGHKGAISLKAVISAEPLDGFLKGSTSRKSLDHKKYSPNY